MRQIKFRGKDVFTEKWVTGDLVHNKKITQDGLKPRTMVGGYEVNPDTVGQFTGLHDANGKEIYEGDILRGKLNKLLYAVTFYNGCFYASIEVCYVRKFGGFRLDDYLIIYEGADVIGNIHDNKELLKGGNNE